MTHTIIAVVDNNPGVVSRISGLFTRRGYNIESLVTGVTDDARIYHLTIIARGTEEQKDQIVHQLAHIQEVISVSVSDNLPHVTREMMLLRVACAGETQETVVSLSKALGCRTVAKGADFLVLEASGKPEDLLSLRASIEKLAPVTSVRGGAMSVLL